MATPYPFTQPLQLEAQDLARSVDFVNRLLAGEQIALPGLGAVGGVIDLLPSIVEQYGLEAAQPMMRQFIDPALSGVWGPAAQQRAMQALANISPWYVDPRLAQWMGAAPASLQELETRSRIIGDLMERFGIHTPWVQQLYTSFMQSAAPRGTLEGLPVEAWRFVATPYLQALAQLQVPAYLQQGLPVLQLPASTEGLSRPAAETVRRLHRALAELQGMQVGPQGLVTETPMQAAQRTTAGAPQAIAGGWPENPGLPTLTPFGAQIPPQTQAEARERRPLLERARETISQIARRLDPGTWFAPDPPGTTWQQLMSQFPDPRQLYQALIQMELDPQLQDQLSQDERLAIRNLLNWVQPWASQGRWPRLP